MHIVTICFIFLDQKGRTTILCYFIIQAPVPPFPAPSLPVRLLPARTPPRYGYCFVFHTHASSTDDTKYVHLNMHQFQRWLTYDLLSFTSCRHSIILLCAGHVLAIKHEVQFTICLYTCHVVW
jgi:hypothetical protein